MAKNVNIVALNKHIAFLTSENQRLRSELDNREGRIDYLRGEVKKLEKAGATVTEENARLMKRVYDLESQVLHMPRNRPEDRSGLGRPFHHVPKGWDILSIGDMGDAVIKPKPPAQPVKIEIGNHRITIEEIK